MMQTNFNLDLFDGLIQQFTNINTNLQSQK